MIWRQDGDPPHTRKGWLRCLYEAPGGGPLVQELWRVTAHETADMVCQILSGDGRYYGLGQYQALWQNEPEDHTPPPRRVFSARELAHMHEAEAIMAEHSRIVRAFSRCQEKIASLEYRSFLMDENTRKDRLRVQRKRYDQLRKQFKILRARRERFKIKEQLTGKR